MREVTEVLFEEECEEEGSDAAFDPFRHFREEKESCTSQSCPDFIICTFHTILRVLSESD